MVGEARGCQGELGEGVNHRVEVGAHLRPTVVAKANLSSICLFYLRPSIETVKIAHGFNQNSK